MSTPKKILLLITILLFLLTSSYPFIVIKLHGRIHFASEEIEDRFQWMLFILWSASLWVLGYLYNKLATADIKMLIIALMGIVSIAILFCDLATHFFGYGNDEEKLLYKNRNSQRKVIVERFHGAGAIGSDYYDTIYIYQIMSWIRYEKPFERTKFDSTQWVNFTSTQK